ncbi:MAG: hypothetical protein KC978_17380, partial [Candidatus Omnitrophica bacterium]|nr:hypothetical protein [Candidatus Omnitrophota bacterium]
MDADSIRDQVLFTTILFILAVLLRSESLSAGAEIVQIHFDTLPDGTRINDEYSESGVSFVNDFQIGRPYRSSPQITTTASARTVPNVLVNTAQDSEVFSSKDVPLVLYFIRPISGIGLQLGCLSGCGTVPNATVSLYDCAGFLQGQDHAVPDSNFLTGLQVLTAANKTAHIAIIDYGPSTTPEAIDDLAFQIAEATCSDVFPPVVTIDSHSNNQMVAESSIILRGKASDSSGVITRVRINGVDAASSPSNSSVGIPYYEFNHPIDLTEGTNYIPIIAWDGAGNKGTTSLYLHRGSPTSVSLSEFHLTQRGIMKAETCDIDDPFVAGKFTIVRIKVDARTSTGAPTYVSSVEMKLYRHEGGNRQLVRTFVGTTYNPFVSQFDSASALAGIHFWLDGFEFAQPGEYSMEFQAYLGINPVGPVLEVPCTDNTFDFRETKTVSMLIVSTESQLFDNAWGAEHLAKTMKVLRFFKRAYPIAENGLHLVHNSPLPVPDGSQQMMMDWDYIKGTGFTWNFIDDHPDGLFRSKYANVKDASNTNIGGRVTSASLVNLAPKSPYGYFRPGAPWVWEGKKFPVPIDDNHDGTTIDDMPNYLAEFFDQETNQWSTNINDYSHGETFRGFRDMDGDQEYDKGEPIAPITQRWDN